MKIKIKTKALKNALALHKNIVMKKTYTTILTGVKLEANKDLLEIISTDLERSLKSKIECEITDPGKCVAQFKILENIVNCCSDEFIELELIPGTNELKADKVKANTLSIDEFPLFPEIKADHVLRKLDYGSFMDSLNKIIGSVSKDQSRATLTGVLFDTTNNCLVATDSYRLAVSKYYFNRDIGNFVIPGNIYPVLKEMAKNKNIKFDMVSDDNQVIFAAANQILICRKLDGKYPGYQELIPGSFNYQYQIQSKDLIRVIDKANKLFGQADNIPIKLKFNSMQIDTEIDIKESGNYQDTIPMNPLYRQDDCEQLFGFNRYLLKDCIKNFDTVTINIIEPLKPILLTNPSSEFKYLLMPIRIT